MDDHTFKIKNLEFHLKQKSFNYDNCVSGALKLFIETNSDFDTAILPCFQLKNELNSLLEEYKKYGKNN